MHFRGSIRYTNSSIFLLHQTIQTGKTSKTMTNNDKAVQAINWNRLYVNASEVENADFGLSESDVAFTKSFYQKGE